MATDEPQVNDLMSVLNEMDVQIKRLTAQHKAVAESLADVHSRIDDVEANSEVEPPPGDGYSYTMPPVQAPTICDSRESPAVTQTIEDSGTARVRRVFDSKDLNSYGTITVPDDIGTGVGEYLFTMLFNNAGVWETTFKEIDWETGHSGETGDTGDTGKGETGDTGLTGLMGLTGLVQGPTGETGDPGGDTGITGDTGDTPSFTDVDVYLAGSWTIVGDDIKATPITLKVGTASATGTQETVLDGTTCS